MQIDLLFLCVAIPGVLIAGISKGGFGGGASFVATPILALVIDPAMSLGLMLPLLIVMDVAGLRAYWGKWSPSASLRLIAGGVLGVILAAAVYRFTDPDVFRFLIGAISLGFVVFQLGLKRRWWAPRTVPLSPKVGAGCGVVMGFTSFVAHAGGPAALIYLLSLGLGKVTFQATTVAVFSVMNLSKVGIYGALGFINFETLKLALLLAPVALIGVLLGVKANRLVPERVFFGLTYVLLAGAGLKLVWDALT
ncbi:sulfite exporter TauE/SafE family protein [Rhodobacteraceae bacterium SC52]|nr:sulfite exporter TauE/SafE family protein [Rhodobacteraceae bacterium SC52]